MTLCKKFNIPKTRDPFINCVLRSAGHDEKTGAQRFWISSWNHNSGSTGLLVTESGQYKTYRFGEGDINSYGAKNGFYSAVYIGNETMWLCGGLSRIYSLNFSTGKVTEYDTGARSGMCFMGISHDEVTGKILFSAGVGDGNMQTVSFDTRTGKTVKIYETSGNGSFSSFANGDGTYTYIHALMGENENELIFMRWNPMAEILEERLRLKQEGNYFFRYVQDEKYRVYLPNYGWLNPTSYTIEDELALSAPKILSGEIEWFAHQGGAIFGLSGDVGSTDGGADNSQDTQGTLYRWDLDGCTTELCKIQDMSFGSAALTEKGEILIVNVYGEFYKYTAEGKRLLHIVMDTDAIGATDTIIRIDKNSVLGTAFITQRFWILDTVSGKGYDAGRAAPGYGQVLRTWNKNGKIYMASYTEGTLTEYDPYKAGSFPHNPRIVVPHPSYALRPVAGAEDNDSLYYICSHKYGQTGCTAVKYNAKTGKALINDDILPYEQICFLQYNREHGILVGGSSWKTDCNVGKPKSDKAHIVIIDPKTLKVIRKIQAPGGIGIVHILGAIDDNRYCIFTHSYHDDGKYDQFYSVLDMRKPEACFDGAKFFTHEPPLWTWTETDERNTYLAVHRRHVLKLYFDGTDFKTLKIYSIEDDFEKVFYSGGTVYALTKKEIFEFKL